MTRDEHIAWAKARALEYLPAHPDLAIASITSDLTKHPETADIALKIGLHLADIVLRDDDLRPPLAIIGDLRRAIEAIHYIDYGPAKQ